MFFLYVACCGHNNNKDAGLKKYQNKRDNVAGFFAIYPYYLRYIQRIVDTNE